MASKQDASRELIWGGPTKRFFVSMLTRDISLSDSILDLIDNCIDGAMRKRKDQLGEENVFEGFQATLVITAENFEISDNCGGIPSDSLEDAFSLGRPNIKQDGDLPTIGMYGIGMKRAIFKMGEEARVQSHSTAGTFEIAYSQDWLDPTNDEWELPISTIESDNEDPGVTISIPKLKAEVARSFANDAFMNDLRRHVSENFGYIMQKGFSVVLNGETLEPHTLQLMISDQIGPDSIKAYDFRASYDDVHVRVIVGFFRALVLESEIDEEAESPRERETAGVSVLCNDRLVVLNDKSMKTGWGDGSVPKFHPQFRAIAGIISFSSNNAEKLPIATTKRDLDAGSDIYLKARRACMEGLKEFTNFTNKWKGMETEAAPLFEKAIPRNAVTEIQLAEVEGRDVRGEPGSKKYPLELPLPATRNPKRRVSFVRDEVQIRRVSEYLFEESDQPPSIVGQSCFDRIYEEAEDSE